MLCPRKWAVNKRRKWKSLRLIYLFSSRKTGPKNHNFCLLFVVQQWVFWLSKEWRCFVQWCTVGHLYKKRLIYKPSPFFVMAESYRQFLMCFFRHHHRPQCGLNKHNLTSNCVAMSSIFRRIAADFITLLPIESYLHVWFLSEILWKY